tara:strand:+ start:493 stop:681 length:189 start_codon:yes stop_codon:yes gene_type:complete
MCPFDTVDVTENGEFISFKNGDLIPYEDVEEYYEAGINFTAAAEKELKISSGDYFKNVINPS